ncbi:unnamed protein product, partial [Iphiclides podalirius]
MLSFFTPSPDRIEWRVQIVGDFARRREVYGDGALGGGTREARSRNNPSYFGRTPPAASRRARNRRTAASPLSANYSQSTDVLVVGFGL